MERRTKFLLAGVTALGSLVAAYALFIRPWML